MAETVNLRAEKVVDFGDLLGGDALAGVSLDFNADPLIACWRARPDADRTITRWARELGVPGDDDLIVWRQGGGEWRFVRFESPSAPAGLVQRTPDGWLCVEPRSREPEHNAVLFDDGGRRVSDFHAGDAIQSVQVTSDGKVWVSNFDERDTSVSELAEGLICLDMLGRPIFRFANVTSPSVPGIFDCYALNVVSDSETWAYHYTDFPLVKLVDFEVERVWLNLCPPGSHAFAVSDFRVLFSPGYNERDGLSLVDLRQGTMRQVRIIDAGGNHLGPARERHYRARGSRMFVANKKSLFRVDLRGL